MGKCRASEDSSLSGTLGENAQPEKGFSSQADVAVFPLVAHPVSYKTKRQGHLDKLVFSDS